MNISAVNCIQQVRNTKTNRKGDMKIMAKSKLVKANEKIAEGVVSGYKAIENGVVGGYKKIENGVTGAYKKVEDQFVDRYLTKDGESVEDAKERLKTEQEQRKEERMKAAQERTQKAALYVNKNIM
jgi:hypothetical protein